MNVKDIEVISAEREWANDTIIEAFAKEFISE